MLFGRILTSAATSYKLPIHVLHFTASANICLGIARAAIDAFVELAQAKTPTMSQTPLAARPTVHAGGRAGRGDVPVCRGVYGRGCARAHRGGRDERTSCRRRSKYGDASPASTRRRQASASSMRCTSSAAPRRSRPTDDWTAACATCTRSTSTRPYRRCGGRRRGSSIHRLGRASRRRSAGRRFGRPRSHSGCRRRQSFEGCTPVRYDAAAAGVIAGAVAKRHAVAVREAGQHDRVLAERLHGLHHPRRTRTPPRRPLGSSPPIVMPLGT